ncbi:MAG: bifunctional acetate--CoA ligase family protein/GNAT family N-acetyltransferase [Acidobacteriota bacterium]|nr:bifunctional acetate--CoA ligase family protein/GNAT family N-acetyltransferase [Acidobacteriota bacterium]
MSMRYLKNFFRPKSIAIVGASPRADSFGSAVLRNIQGAGFQGPLHVVNRRNYGKVSGVPAFKKVSGLPDVPDLAIVCTPPATVPGVIEELGRFGVAAALVLMGGMARLVNRGGVPLRKAALAAARPYGIRIMGPNSLGIQVPDHYLNASYAHLEATPGKVAFVGQSAMLGNALLDWARGRGVGFSHFLTLGDSMDVDLDDVLDYLAADHKTKAVLMHVEHIRRAGPFISALRATSRVKPVLAFKSVDTAGLEPAEPAPGVLHRDDVWDQVFSRAGVLRVGSLERLFEALTTLTRLKPFYGERLAILANGLGPARMAYEQLKRLGGKPAAFSEETRRALRDVLPSFCQNSNPVDLNAEAGPDRYARALSLVDLDPGVDAILVIHAPGLPAPSLEFAEAVLKKKTRAHLFTCWMGAATVGEARAAFDAAGVPTFDTPEEAIRAHTDRCRHERNQSMLRQTPQLPRVNDEPNRLAARSLIAVAEEAGNHVLMPEEARALLTAYGIPSAETLTAEDEDAACRILEDFDGLAAAKVVLPGLLRPFAYSGITKTWRRGVIVDLDTPQRFRRAAERLLARLEDLFPGQEPLGWILQGMRRGPGSIMISMGLTRDPVFGPILFCGEGGSIARLTADRQLALPPLNRVLARELLSRTRIPTLLSDVLEDPQPHLDALTGVLLKLSAMAVDLPRLAGLEINPFLVRGTTLRALDTAVSLGPPVQSAIRAYPGDLQEETVLKDGMKVTLRPIRGEDEPAHARFAKSLSRETVRLRFFTPIARLGHKQLAQLTQIDYAREMCFIASAPDSEGTVQTLGVVRCFIDADNFSAEMAVVVRDDMAGKGLGSTLIRKLIRYCTDRNIVIMTGTVLPENTAMLGLARALGFKVSFNLAEGVNEINLQMNEPQDDWQARRLAGIFGEVPE